MRSFLILSAVSALHILGVSAQDAKADCINRGIANAITQATTWGCTSAEDKTCLCGSALTTFKEAVGRYAYTDCQAQADEITGFFSDSYCKGIVVSSSSAVPSTTATVASSSVTSATSTAETTTAVTSSATTQSTQSSSSSSEVSSTATSTAASSSVTSKASTTLVTSATSTSGTAAATSTSAGKDNQKDDDSEAAAAGGLSKGAAVGIGVGVGVAVIAIVVIIVALLLRRKRQNQAPAKRPLDISRPIQKESRPYTSPDRGSFGEKRGGERGGESFEMTSNRYEDMLPRQTPRTMV